MDKLLIFSVSATNAVAMPVSQLAGIDLVDADTINFSFIGGNLANGTTKSTLVTCDITSGTYLATLKEISEYIYASGSMKLPYVDVAGIAGTAGTNISNITSCTAIAIDQ
tara:strand:- start:319 stop:648 length:330 start_codon:yes stop_codon:yes gene_type:complete